MTDAAAALWHAGDHLLRVRGALVGGALGDALGYSRLQHALRESPPAVALDLEQLLEQSNGAASEYSQLTLFSCEGILRGTVRAVEYGGWEPFTRAGWHGTHGYVLAARSYLRWLHTQDGFDPDADTVPCAMAPGWLLGHPLLRRTRPAMDGLSRAALRRILANPECDSGAVATNDVEGAGAVVRAAPFGLVCVGDPFRVAHESARITHYRSNSRTTAAAYAILIDLLLGGKLELARATTETARRLGEHPKSAATVSALSTAASLLDKRTPDISPPVAPPRTPAEVLAFSIVCAGAPDARTALLAALHHTGDVAATAAITGTLFGVVYGVLAIPPDLIERLELAAVMFTAADDLIVGYGASDAWRERYPGC